MGAWLYCCLGYVACALTAYVSLPDSPAPVTYAKICRHGVEQPVATGEDSDNEDQQDEEEEDAEAKAKAERVRSGSDASTTSHASGAALVALHAQ